VSLDQNMYQAIKKLAATDTLEVAFERAKKI
jgi:hypothetical protein